MSRVPADLDLSRFKGATLIQLRIGEFQVQFAFHPRDVISVEGKWELRDANNTLIDKSVAGNAERDAYRVHVILGKRVETCSVSAPDSFSLRFESGHTLTIFDDSSQHESFSIQPGNIFI